MIYRCCLIGYGRIGKLHYNNIVKNASLSMDYIVETENMIPHLQKELDNIHFSSNLTDLLENHNIDLVFVCSPTDKHHEHIMVSLNNDKHVFCEKPLSNHESHIKECYEKAKEKNLILLCAYNRRFDPKIIELKDNLSSIGKIMQVNTLSRDYPYPSVSFLKTSTGIYKDCAIHDIDYVCWLLNDKPITVYTTGNIIKPYDEGLGELDNVILAMEFSDGKLANIQLSRISQNYDQRAYIFGETGSLEMNNPYHNNDNPISFPQRYKNAYLNELNHFIQCIEGTDNIKVTLNDCLNSHYIVNACELSYQSGTKISVKYDN